MRYSSDTGAGHYFEGGIISPDPNMHFGLRFNSVDGVVDFDAGDYLCYSRSSDEYLFMIGSATKATIDSSGNLVTYGALCPSADANFRLQVAGGKPAIQFDANDNLTYDRANNSYIFGISGTTKVSIDAGGLLSTGVLAAGDVNFMLGISSSQPTIMFDTGGDQIVYDRTANKFYFVIGGVNVASIDASGNLRIKGTLSQGVTP